jgi:hypothetical protein
VVVDATARIAVLEVMVEDLAVRAVEKTERTAELVAKDVDVQNEGGALVLLVRRDAVAPKRRRSLRITAMRCSQLSTPPN